MHLQICDQMRQAIYLDPLIILTRRQTKNLQPQVLRSYLKTVYFTLHQATKQKTAEYFSQTKQLTNGRWLQKRKDATHVFKNHMYLNIVQTKRNVVYNTVMSFTMPFYTRQRPKKAFWAWYHQIYRGNLKDHAYFT